MHVMDRAIHEEKELIRRAQFDQLFQATQRETANALELSRNQQSTV
jgi:hypothetical protein